MNDDNEKQQQQKSNRKRGRISSTLSDIVGEVMLSETNEEVSRLEQELSEACTSAPSKDKEVINAILLAQKITNARLEPLSAVIKQTTANAEKIKKVDSRVAAVEKIQAQHSDSITILEQSRLETQATITGFNEIPDENNLKPFLCEMANISQSAIIKIQSFTIKKKNGENMIITNVHFSDTFSKSKLFAVKMERGTMLAKQFFPSLTTTNGADNVIFIGHKLTNTNIRLRKKIIELQAAKKVKTKRFRNNRFQIQLSNDARWLDITSFALLEKISSE